MCLAGPAEDAGILAGDVILSFDGKEVPDTRELVRMVGDSDVGAVVRVVIFREGATQTIGVTLGRREDAEAGAPAAGAEAPKEEEVLGMTLLALTPDVREDMGLESSERGVAVLGVEEGSEAFEKGIRAGDVIAEIGQQPVTTPGEIAERFEAAREAGRKSILLLVRREGQPRFVALSPEE